MTFEELREVLKEGKAVTHNNKTYIKIENGKMVERYQENDEIVLKGEAE